MQASDVLKATGRVIGYRPKLALMFGNVCAELLFEQVFYWQGKTDNPLGVYKTKDQWREEIGLTRDQLDTARKVLKKLGVLIETEKRLEHRTFYRIDEEKLNALIQQHYAKESQLSPNTETNSPESGKPVFGAEGNPLSSIHKITTKDYIQDITPLTPHGEVSDETAEGGGAVEKSQSTAKTKKSLSLDYDAIKFEFNQAVANTNIPQVRVLSDNRKRLIKSLARVLQKEFAECEPETFRNYFNDFVEQAKARKDNFYFGGGKTSWVADFDYVLKIKTFTKTLEGGI